MAFRVLSLGAEAAATSSSPRSVEGATRIPGWQRVVATPWSTTW